MIIEIRKGLQSKAVRVIVSALIIATFVAAALIPLFEYFSGPKSSWLIKINGEAISPELYNHERRQQEQLLKNIRAQYGELAEWLLQMSGLPTNTIALTEQSLVQSTLLNQQARQASLRPSPVYVQQQIANPERGMRLLAQVVPAELLTPSGIDQQLFGLYLKRIGLTEKEVEKLLENAVGRQMLLSVVSGLAYVPQFYTLNESRLATASRTISVALLKIAPSIDVISDEQLQQFYDQQIQSGHYRNPEKRSATIWRFDPGSYDLTIADKRARDYYQKNKQQFIDNPTKVSIQYALFKPNEEYNEEWLAGYVQELHDTAVKNPEQFEQLVNAAKLEGIDVSFEIPEPFERGQMIETFGNEFDRRVFTLPTDNSLTPVISTEQGLMLIKRISKQKRIYKTFEQVESEIRDQLRQERFLQRFTSDVSSRVSGDNTTQFQEFTRKHKATEQTLALHPQGEQRYDEYLFSAKEGVLTPFIDGQVGIVVRVDQVEPASVQQFSEIKERVEKDLRTLQGRKAATDTIATILEETKSEQKTLEQAVDEQGLTLKSVQLSVQDTQEAAKKLASYGIDPQSLLSLRYQGALASSNELPASGDYAYIARLDALESGEENGQTGGADPEIGAIRQNITQSIQGGYVASLRKNATIEMNSSMPIPQ